MKKTIEVTIIKEFEIEILDECLTQEFLDSFQRSFYDLDDPAVDSLFVHVASTIAHEGRPEFIEGVGDCAPAWEKRRKAVKFKEISCDTECEVNE